MKIISGPQNLRQRTKVTRTRKGTPSLGLMERRASSPFERSKAPQLGKKCATVLV